MGVIKVLPEIIANKIAAGEVVERPASIVKELVENALDAGAQAVEIEVKNGGKSLIRVTDDGSGMEAGDAEAAFQRHATSKIATEKDLERIVSFGFRGEALASIAAVSRVRMLTRVKGKSSGTEVVIEGGRSVSVKEAASREGTTLEVRDLFFNTPARRKFLKTDSTELGHVMDAVANLAIANPAVHFVLISAGKTVWGLLPGEDLMPRVCAIWGEDHAAHLVRFEAEGGGVRIWGIAGKPFLARANRSGQVFYINRRWIRSLGLSYALQDAYHGRLMQGQYPVAAVFIEADPERVDVNVHPTKQEVRISKEAEIKSLLRRAVAEKLEAEGDMAPKLEITEMPEKTPGRPSIPEWMSESAKTPAQKGDLAIKESAAAIYVSSSAAEPVEPEPAISFRDQLKVTRILGQVHATYILAETEEGLMIVDQHAAHERVMFEEILAELESESPRKQGLLMEEVLEVHPRQSEVLEALLPLLSKIGFEIENFGENSFVIRAYPAALREEDPVGCVKRCLEAKEEGKLKADLEHAREEIAALLACKTRAVKARDPMTPVAMRSLLERLSACRDPFHCPHGRPAFIKFAVGDLEKQFHRK
ncbi:MAG: DNA mismatch repair endonuclease MutL [Candidatus Omnitrophota bacterium]